MEAIRKNPKLLIIAAGIIAVIVAAIVGISQSSNQAGNESDTTNPTSFHSGFAEASDENLVNYSGSAAPNEDAAAGHFKIFALKTLGFPKAIQAKLPDILEKAITKAVTPTYAFTYIQIDKSTIKCTDIYDCSFSFYLDSPEAYFSIHIYYDKTGLQTYTLNQLALPEGGK